MSMNLCMPLHGAERGDALGSQVSTSLSSRETKDCWYAFGTYATCQRQAELQRWENLMFKEVQPCLESNGQLPLLENFAQTLQKHRDKKNFRCASRAHLYMCYLGLEDQRLLRDLVVSSFVECGRISIAQQILSRFSDDSLCIWPSLLESYVDGGDVKHALTLFLQEHCDCAQRLSKSALQALVKCCTKLKCAKQGLQVHVSLVRGGLDTDILLATSLVEMYAKCGLLVKAREVLDEMPTRDVFAWNVLSLGYAECGSDREALQCFEWLKMEGLSPNCVTFVVALKVCGNIDLLERGRELHTEIALMGFESDTFVASALSDMYAKCCRLLEAERVFEGLQSKDVVSWTALISQFTEHGQGVAALDFFERMQVEGVLLPNAVTYMGSLKACTSVGDLVKGQQLHAEIIMEGFEQDSSIGNTLVDMYGKCDRIIEAQAVFEELPIKDVISWTALLAGYREHGLDDEVLSIVETMQNDGVRLDPIAFVHSIKACANSQAFHKGLSIHCEIVKEEFEANTAVSSALMDMYAKGGLLSESEEVFDELLLRDVISWTARMTCFLEFGLCKEALACLEKMQIEGVSPNSITYVCSLQACILLEAIDVGRELHGRIVLGGFDKDAIVSNALVDLYAKCGSFEETWQTFDHHAVKDVASWNTLIAAFSEHEVGQEVLNTLEKMQAEGFSPNLITFLSCLRTCSLLGAEGGGKQIHAEIIKVGYEGDLLLANTLVDMYTKSGSTFEAYDVFNKMGCRDAVSWNILIAGHAEHQLGEQGLQCLEKMVVDGVLPNISTLVGSLKCCASIAALGAGQELHSKIIREGHEINAIIGSTLVDMYASCGLLMDARKVFDNMSVKGVAWNIIISGYANHGQDVAVLSCYDNMLAEGASPDTATFASVLKACGNMGAILRGQEVHNLAIKMGSEDDPLVSTMLIDMFSKGGCLMDACKLFEMLIEKDVVSWGTLIAGFARYGQCEAIFHFLGKMEGSGVLPDGVLLLNILSACSHMGLVDIGQAYFQAIEERYSIGITAEHYNCLIDLLSRAGHLEMATLMISRMPCKPSSMTWSSMLGACRNWGNGELAQFIFELAWKSDGTQAATVYLMQNIYADSDIWEQAYIHLGG